MEEMCEAIEYEKSVQSGWLNCFSLERKQLYRTALVATFQMFQQLTGANYFLYVSHPRRGTCVASVLTDLYAVLCNGVPGCRYPRPLHQPDHHQCCQLWMHVRRSLHHGDIQSPYASHYQRFWQSIWLFVFAAGITAEDPSMFILGYAMTWGPGIWILVGETFPTRTWSKQAAVLTAAASNWLWNFLIALALCRTMSSSMGIMCSPQTATMEWTL